MLRFSLSFVIALAAVAPARAQPGEGGAAPSESPRPAAPPSEAATERAAVSSADGAPSDSPIAREGARDPAPSELEAERAATERAASTRPASTRPAATRDPDYLRAFFEEVLFLAGGTAWYWIEKDDNSVDWDYDAWAQRFEREAFRFDNNRFAINWVFHPFSGSAFHGFARANDLSVGAAFLYGFFTSFAWEWLLEFRERVSINDQIATPLPGLAIGEFFIKLGRYLHARALTPARRAASWTLGFPVQMHRAWDDRAPDPDERAQLHGAFRVAYGATLARGDTGQRFGLHTMAFEGRLADLRGYLRPGRRRTFFADAELADLRARATRGPGGGGFELEADTVVLGLHAQDLEDAPGGLRGAAGLVGASIAYRYARQSYADWTDRLGVVHLPGLALEGHLFGGPVALHLGARVHADFASVHAKAPFDAWFAAQPEGTRAKTILEREGYYFGWGLSTESRVALALGPVELGVRTRFGSWWSDEGLDRSQEEVNADVRVRDRALDVATWARLDLPRGLQLEARLDLTRRDTDVAASVRTSRTLRRATLLLAWRR
ncbi:MAG TPA: DUF3943 domain-containing protein [Polyangiaceae bacterium LLY-WYZ-15_(1-7)]|nr:hypothetical protein [Sandaracinus sp.]HJL01781.1 DUF3943 domain-containing protein [Polyangiaceae bacterium LLY-WYZ-15_(1-7)]